MSQTTTVDDVDVNNVLHCKAYIPLKVYELARLSNSCKYILHPFATGNNTRRCLTYKYNLAKKTRSYINMILDYTLVFALFAVLPNS